jgi:uncharacterized protein YacL
LIIPSFVLNELAPHCGFIRCLETQSRPKRAGCAESNSKGAGHRSKNHREDYNDIAEVDAKLLKLGQQLHAKVITNDYNLNKVAEFQGVEVLNINELANAVKPVVLPGEEMVVQVIKDGKETGQGIAYLDDGTMIVVDGGKKHVGETIDVMVTSVLQTAAGRMIFAKPKSVEKVVS